MCGSRTEYPYPPDEWSLEIPRGWGFSNANILKGTYKAKLEFPEVLGVKTRKPSLGGGMDIFWNHIHGATCSCEYRLFWSKF